jgi:phosphatidylserine/phosphatidylglycerophosphate/cardiolipin synthase-like enzyme
MRIIQRSLTGMTGDRKIDSLLSDIRISLEDNHISRSEKKAIRARLEEAALSKHQVNILRSNLFDLAREESTDPAARRLIDWLEILENTIVSSAPRVNEHSVFFSPGDDCLNGIISLLESATSSVDICVFSISDDRIARAIAKCHTRKVPVRIITDDDKTRDRGSDIITLSQSGIPVRVDNSPDHMHHKFAVIDGKKVISGSFNWTRSASSGNRENILITTAPSVVEAYTSEFEKLWEEFS